MMLFQHALGDHAFCNKEALPTSAKSLHIGAFKHKELDRNSTEYEYYQKYFWLDEILYEAVKVLYQEQLQKAQEIPELKAQLDQLT